MTSASTNRGFPWQTVVVALLAVALLAWFLRGINVHELSLAIGRANLSCIAAAIAVTIATYVFRAWRWQALLAPIGGASFRNSFRVTAIGFTATNVLPGRLGEILRPYLISRAENVTAPAAFATVLIERLLDLSCVMLLFGVFLMTSAIDVGPQVKMAGMITSAVAASALIGLVFGAGRPETLRRWADAITGKLPVKIAAIAQRFAHTLIDGLAVLRHPRHLVVAAWWSLCLWLAIALGIVFTSLAFGLTMAFSSAFLVMMYLVVGVAVPVPAGVGSFHFMYQLAADTLHAGPREEIIAAAIVLHMISVLPISMFGLVFMAQDGLTLARLRGVQSDGGLQ